MVRLHVTIVDQDWKMMDAFTTILKTTKLENIETIKN